MSKPKYPFEKRLEVVNHYFTTDDGYRIISARFGVPRTQVRTWVALYEKHGEKGLIPKPKGVSADPELRIKVVKAVIEQHMSLNQAAAHFMLAGSGSVARWLRSMKSAEKLVYARSRLAPKETLQYQLIQKKRHQHWSCQKTDALRILKGKFDFLKRGLCI